MLNLKIPETVSAPGLRCRADIMRRQGDESCARHCELAADKIDELCSALDEAVAMLLKSEQSSKACRAKIAGVMPQRT